MANVAGCWRLLEDILSSGLTSTWSPVHPSDELKEAIAFLASPGMNKLLEEWMYEKIFQDLNNRVRNMFWHHFGNMESEEDDPSGEKVHSAFGVIYEIYKNHYMVALARLQWLQGLAVLVPSVSRRPTQTDPISAFTPVKGKNLVERGQGGRLQGPRKLQAPLEEASNVKTQGRHLSVKFERGTKGDDDDDEEDNDMELKEYNSDQEDDNDFECGKRMEVNSMDGSYIPPNSLDHSLFSNTSTRDVSEQLLLNLNTTTEGEKEDDDELFIRSPIGGSQTSAAINNPNPRIARPLFFGHQASNPPTPAGVSQTPADSSMFALRAMSQTSTPGLSLKQAETPGPLTPIEHHNSSDLFSNKSCLREGDTPLVPNPKIAEASSRIFHSSTGLGSLPMPESLPDASQIFGESVSTRPVPGINVTWPTDDSCRSADNSNSRLVTMIRAILFTSFPHAFAESVKAFYLASFDAHKASLDSSSLSDRANCLSDNQKRFDKMNAHMDEMGLMELISGASVTQIVHTQIEKHIAEQCKGNFDTAYLGELEEWLNQLVLGWLTRIYASKHTQQQKARLDAFRDRLRHFVYETYAKSLISQLFDIIIDYPDSKPAIVDLSVCLKKTDLRAELVAHLKSALENRLLHPGVNTADILTAYISAIKALRLLESAGVILELVCEPVGRYLRSREDTVRCIVASLTDEGNNELISELVNTKPVDEDNDDDDGSMKHWEDWMPDPVDADPSIVSKNRRSADILSTLVNIYGSKELFVNEYRALLADRILVQYNYDEQRELRYLELLKLRFGESHLHFCEVMLRDVTESRRVNTRVQELKAGAEKNPNDIEMNAMILSAQFWPAFRDEKITLPPELQAHLDSYTKQFESQKQNRTLVWKPHLGMMNIELDFKDETLNFSVSPVQAAIIMKFQGERTKWTVDELSSELEMTASVLRRKITFWQSQGLLKEVQTDVFQLVEDRKGCPHEMVAVEEEEVESAMASAQQQKEEEMQVFWTYIQSMLSNLNCLPLERIHSMLRIFAMGDTGSTEITMPELKTFLDNKVKDQILVFSGGVYRLNK